jgi:hypothetical protein
MENDVWDRLPGKTLQEKLALLGIEIGRMMDIRDLDAAGCKYGIDIFLLFEKDLICTRTMGELEEEYRHVPEYERPYIRVGSFLRFARENDPTFARTLEEFPLMVEIATIAGTHQPGSATEMPVIIGLMPFLDELDPDAPAPQ